MAHSAAGGGGYWAGYPATFCSLWAGPISGLPTLRTKIGIFSKVERNDIQEILQIANVNVQRVCQIAPKHTIGRLNTKKFFCGRGSPLTHWGGDSPPQVCRVFGAQSLNLACPLSDASAAATLPTNVGINMSQLVQC